MLRVGLDGQFVWEVLFEDLALMSHVYRIPTGRLYMVLLAHFILKSVHATSEPCSGIV